MTNTRIVNFVSSSEVSIVRRNELGFRIKCAKGWCNQQLPDYRRPERKLQGTSMKPSCKTQLTFYVNSIDLEDFDIQSSGPH